MVVVGINMNYFTDNEEKRLTKEELFIQASIGLQTCLIKKDVIEILEDVWNIAQKRCK